MRTILFLAYYYPPVNNAGTQRLAKFIKYLPEYNFRPIVLTTNYFSRAKKNVRSFRITRRLIEHQEENGALVYRVSELRNLGLRKNDGRAEASGYAEEANNSWKTRIKQFVKTWLIFPDPKITWLPFAFFYSLWLIKKYKIEYIFSSFPPATAHLLALFLKKCTDVKWIADFRDGWCCDPLDPAIARSPSRFFLEKLLEKKAAKNCDRLLVTSPDAGEYFNDFKEKTSLITNGYDQDDFKIAEQGLKKFADLKKCFVISHTGALHYSHPGNTPRYFFAGLKQAFGEHSEMKEKTRVFFLGNLTPQEKKMAHQMGLGTRVKVLGLKSHLESIRYRLISDILLLIDRPIQSRSSYIHGKVFEHLASRKTILALLPSGACRDFLEKLGVGEIVEPQDISGIAKKLWELFCKWRKGGILRYELTEKELQQFERKNLTRKLTEILEGGSQ